MNERMSNIVGALKAGGSIFIMLLPIISLIGYFVFVIYFGVFKVNFSGEISSQEIRFYILLAFGFLILLTFGLLRLYNAVVNTTRFIIKLQKQLKDVNTSMRSWSSAITSNHKVLVNSTKALEKLGGSIADFGKSLTKSK